ncbi:hypothetical protein MMON44395_05080 [Mycolicibacterium monacense DSM 44395]|nr:hypothetical protein [Mycolicibacterium monacense DSM 44395]
MAGGVIYTLRGEFLLRSSAQGIDVALRISSGHGRILDWV